MSHCCALHATLAKVRNGQNLLKQNDTDGRPKQLINFIFFRIVEFTMVLPDPTSYRNIVNAQHTPKVSMKSVFDYLLANDKVFEEKYRYL